MQDENMFGDSLPSRSAATPKRFRILMLGDFGSESEWGSPITVDRDNLDDVFRKLNVRVHVQGNQNGPELQYELEELDDFHPDRLFERMPLFESLRTRRRRLKNDKTFAEESAAILAARGEDPTAGKDEANSDDSADQGDRGDVQSLDPSDLLSQAIDQTPQPDTAQRPVVERMVDGTLDFDDYVRQVVQPYVLQKSDPRKEEFIAGVDAAVSATMRRLLHEPQFKQVEAAWLGVQLLVKRLETDVDLKLSLVQVSKQSMLDDVNSQDDLSGSKLHSLLTPASEDDEPWTLVIGSFEFGNDGSDVAALGRVAKISAAAGTVFCASASPHVVGCEDLSAQPEPADWTPPNDEAQQRWQALRALPASQHVVLALPRVLARMSYGRSTDPIDAFPFEENPEGESRQYVWMNPAFGVAALLGSAFSRGGWSLDSAYSPELDGLPVSVFTDDDGESLMQPCGETELPTDSVSALAEAGLTVVRSVRNQGSVLIPTVRSLSEGSDAVAWSWR